MLTIIYDPARSTGPREKQKAPASLQSLVGLWMVGGAGRPPPRGPPSCVTVSRPLSRWWILLFLSHVQTVTLTALRVKPPTLRTPLPGCGDGSFKDGNRRQAATRPLKARGGRGGLSVSPGCWKLQSGRMLDMGATVVDAGAFSKREHHRWCFPPGSGLDSFLRMCYPFANRRR
jgi:hypothetical protein